MNTVKVRNVEIGPGIPKVCVPIVGSTREEILSSYLIQMAILLQEGKISPL